MVRPEQDRSSLPTEVGTSRTFEDGTVGGRVPRGREGEGRGQRLGRGAVTGAGAASSAVGGRPRGLRVVGGHVGLDHGAQPHTQPTGHTEPEPLTQGTQQS